MSSALSAALKEAYAIAPASQTVVDTLELRHPLLTASIYLVKDIENREFTLETAETVVFKACAFEVSLPGTEPELQLTICNVDREIADFIELATSVPEPVEILFRPYLLSDPSEPAMNPPLTMFLNNATVNLMDVVGTASFLDLRNRKFPAAYEYYTQERFPGI